MRTKTLLLLLFVGAPPGFALADATGTVDGTCSDTREPFLDDLSAVFAAITPPPTPPPLSPQQLAQMDSSAEGRFPSSEADKRLIRDVSQIVVPGSYQANGTCMFRALRMVSLHWRSIGYDTEAIPVDDRVPIPKGDAIAYARDVLGFTAPQIMGITTNGAVAVAEHYGYETKVKRKATVRDLEKALAAGTPPIVSFYCCKQDGTPETEVTKLADGSIAPYWHAGVVEGIDRERGVILIKHAWKRREPFVVPLSQFEKSWAHASSELLIVKPRGYKNGEKK